MSIQFQIKWGKIENNGLIHQVPPPKRIFQHLNTSINTWSGAKTEYIGLLHLLPPPTTDKILTCCEESRYRAAPYDTYAKQVSYSFKLNISEYLSQPVIWCEYLSTCPFQYLPHKCNSKFLLTIFRIELEINIKFY